MKDSLTSLLPMFLTVFLAMGGMASYLHINFASASDMQQVEDKLDELGALALGNQIRAMMWEACDNPDNEVLAGMIDEARRKYQLRTEDVFPWICTP